MIRSTTNRSAMRRVPRHRRKAAILILVLVVVAMLALSAYTTTSFMVAENEGAILHGTQLQARSLVDSGASHARYFLELDPAVQRDLGGHYDNPQTFQAQLVIDHPAPRSRARFGIVAPLVDDVGLLGGIRFGLQDESTRLNINALNLDIEAGADLDEQLDSQDDEQDGASGENVDEEEEIIDTSGRAMLLKLPGMTIDVADAILDWIDEDDEPREYGAEIDYYSSLALPYTPQNGALKSIEELLMIRGVTPDLLFGRDVNRNGIIDVREVDLPIGLSTVDDGSMDFGWASYLTLYSQERNANRDGEQRIDLNQGDLQELSQALSNVFEPTWVAYIIAYRQFGAYNGDDEDTEPATALSLDLERPAQHRITQVLDLIDQKVRVEIDGETLVVASPFANSPGAMIAYLGSLMDQCTVTSSFTLPGRININRASKLVLLAVPGFDEQIVNQIINQRAMEESDRNPEFQHETWILGRGIVTLEEMRVVLPFITAGGDVLRGQIVGYFDDGEVSARAEIVFDATRAYPRLLSWKDMSHLGRGFARETLGIDVTGVQTSL